MKKWVKYAIIGAIWGLISTLLVLVMYSSGGLGPIHYLVFLPFTLGFGFLELTLGTGLKILGTGLLSWIVYLITPVFFGALLSIFVYYFLGLLRR
jgi:hypothetical protein